MGAILLGILFSCTTSIILYKWIKNKQDNETYKNLCKKSLKNGILTIFLVILFSGALSILGYIVRFSLIVTKVGINELLYQAYYTFIGLALGEEISKFLAFKWLLKKNPHKYSWFELTVFMTIVGIGFGIIENITFSLGTDPISMLLKGISIGHAGYGFIMGWFYGKMIKTGKKIYGFLGFIMSWLLHGLFDFGLSEELLKINDDFAFISLLLELVCIITVFVIIHFIRKNHKSEKYNEPLEKYA